MGPSRDRTSDSHLSNGTRDAATSLARRASWHGSHWARKRAAPARSSSEKEVLPSAIGFGRWLKAMRKLMSDLRRYSADSFSSAQPSDPSHGASLFFRSNHGS